MSRPFVGIRAALHPAYEAFHHRGEPYMLTGENLKSITGAKAHHNTVYVVENEVLSDRQLAKLKRLQDAILCQTAEFVQKEKKAGYQENLLKQMLGDVLEEV